MVKVIVAKEKINSEHLLGQFLDESHYDHLIDYDCDAYGIAPCDLSEKIVCVKECSECDAGQDERTVLFKFRKNYFTEEEQLGAYEGLHGAAGASQNRGIAAGPKGEKCIGREWVTDEEYEIIQELLSGSEPIPGLNNPIDDIIEKYKHKVDTVTTRGNVWLVNKLREHNFNFFEWVETVKNLTAEEKKKQAEWVYNTFISLTTYANMVNSGVAGWYDRYPRIDWGRATTYTRDHYEEFTKSYPFLQKLSNAFKKYLPIRYNNQLKATKMIDPEFVVPDTVFTTLTVNKSFRTAAHLDAGDLGEGFSNLSVITNGKSYEGAYLVFPEYRIAVNIRPGDLLLVANHTVIHGNTPIILEEGGERISVVAYFREGMLKLGEKKYEDLRFNFIEERRLNKNHPLWKPLWNGISPNWSKSDDFHNYLIANGGEKYLDMYHPEYKQKKEQVSLESFFDE